MGSYLYDDALLAKIQKWTNNTEISVFLQDEFRSVVQRISDTNGDTPMKLPLIVVNRNPSGYSVLEGTRSTRSGNGVRTKASFEKVEILNSIPINIGYSIDVYTRYYRDCDDYMRNLVFNIINYPKLQIDIPYNDIHMLHDSSIRITTEIMDTSSNVPMYRGQITRMSVGIAIDDAYLWDTRIRNTVSLVDGSSIIMNDIESEPLRLNDD